jgi:4-amino-4-deoxy-L-arabinose transferase-like glycosyltransferase
VNIQSCLSLLYRYPRAALLLITIPLLFLNGHHQSLQAHDEGYYAVQARWIWETGDWLTPQWWGLPIYDRTIGLQWLIALSYHLLGFNEFALRLPSMIACAIGVLLTYEIGKILFTQKIAWLGACILMLMALWLSESHTAQQNTALVSIELFGIWSLLQVTDVATNSLLNSSRTKKNRWLWGIGVGAAIGLGFLFKGVMIAVPIVALLPHIFFKQRYLKLLSNLGVYLGLILGAIPTGLWLFLSYQKYGMMPIQELAGKILFLSKTNNFNPSPFYYLWNLPANIFPWALFSLIGAIVVWRKLLPEINYSVLSLSLGYPITLFVLLSLFRTRMPYYMMQLLPFMALLAATAFIYFLQVSRYRSIRWYRLVTWLSYAFSGLGLILLLAGILLITNALGATIPAEIRVFALPAIILGGGWASIAVLWQRWQPPHVPYWLASWLLPAWSAILIIGLQGVWVNKTPTFLAEFHQPAIDQVITHQSVNLWSETVEADGFKTTADRENLLGDDEHQALVLLSFYTSHLGKHISDFAKLPNRSYAWTRKIPPQLVEKTVTIGKVRGWQLIQKLPDI